MNVVQGNPDQGMLHENEQKYYFMHFGKFIQISNDIFPLASVFRKKK